MKNKSKKVDKPHKKTTRKGLKKISGGIRISPKGPAQASDLIL